MTAPDAWRTAFGRFFPGAAVIKERQVKSHPEIFKSNRRLFTRLTAEGHWRDEYVLRGHLLRSLEKGRPVVPKTPPTTGTNSPATQSMSPITLSEGSVKAAITCTDVSFDVNGREGPSIILGSWFLGETRITNPLTSSEVNLDDTSVRRRISSFSNFAPNEEMYGLGRGLSVGCPNPMDVSRPYGMILGGGYAGGSIWLRGVQGFKQFLLTTHDASLNDSGINYRVLGVPDMTSARESITAVWIAKGTAIPSLSEGMVGVLVGTSAGIISSYSLGIQGLRDRHIKTGDLTARWILSPGVPIISLVIDNDYSIKRQAQNRIWAVAVNALGEVFYLTKFPKRVREDYPPPFDTEINAWLSGRTVYWNMIDITRRVARELCDAGNSYSPRSSWNGMCLSVEQIRQETVEMERYFLNRPVDIRNMCCGWDMQRMLQVDFAGEGGNYAGEAVVVVASGFGDDQPAQARRYVRCRTGGYTKEIGSSRSSGRSTPRATEASASIASSIFGTPERAQNAPAEINDVQDRPPSTLRTRSSESSPSRPTEEWRFSDLDINSKLSVNFTASTIDCSKLATLTVSEDPFFSNVDEDSSDTSSMTSIAPSTNTALIPGQRARFLAIGTDTGAIYLWDMRRSIPKSTAHSNPLKPLREIYTESPSISSLALTSLYLVHGGSDGLVQAWDPLASVIQPVRTISGRPTGRFRRQIMRNHAIAIGTPGFPTSFEYNHFAAATIQVDLESSMLRGVVTIGSVIRTWAFRSSDLERHVLSRPNNKRRRRRASDRRGSARGGVEAVSSRDPYRIKQEMNELRREQQEDARNKAHLARRFGFGTLGEQDELALAMLMSEESFNIESSQSEATTPHDLSRENSFPTSTTSEEDRLAEAIRLSLLESSPPAESQSWSQVAASGSHDPEVELELVLAMSLVDQGGLQNEIGESSEVQSPRSDGSRGKGKRRAD